MNVLVEACVDSVTSARQAEAAGARRLELCRNLEVGGTTPDFETLARVREHTRLPLHVLIRPRGGDFHYQRDEAATLLADIAAAASGGADGVVLGAVRPDGRVDSELTRRLVAAARPLNVTFHRAFDHVRDPLEALDSLLELGIERVLTAGHAGTAEAGIPVLQRLLLHARGRLTILAGGGIRAGNAARIVRETGVRELHLRYGEWFGQVVKNVNSEQSTVNGTSLPVRPL